MSMGCGLTVRQRMTVRPTVTIGQKLELGVPDGFMKSCLVNLSKVLDDWKVRDVVYARLNMRKEFSTCEDAVLVNACPECEISWERWKYHNGPLLIEIHSKDAIKDLDEQCCGWVEARRRKPCNC